LPGGGGRIEEGLWLCQPVLTAALAILLLRFGLPRRAGMISLEPIYPKQRAADFRFWDMSSIRQDGVASMIQVNMTSFNCVLGYLQPAVIALALHAGVFLVLYFLSA
jgi:hypothetical protein